MNDGTEDQLQVSFPASSTFTRIGRVAVAGLALRLGLDVARVEQLRLAVDTAVGALHGAGRITVHAYWRPDELLIELRNSEITIDRPSELADELAPMVEKVTVESDQISLLLLTNEI